MLKTSPWCAVLLPLLACSSAAIGPTDEARPMPEKSAERPAWHVRREVTVVEGDRPVEGAALFSLVEGRPLGRTDAAGRAAVWSPHDDTLLAVRGPGLDAPCGEGWVGV